MAVQAVGNTPTRRMHKGANTTLDEAQMLVAHTLRSEGHDASEDGTGRGVPLTCGALMHNKKAAGSLTPQDAAAGQCVTERHGVRRLTPRECERLQGFPDDYTQVPFRGKPMSDSARYKMLGNSMAVNVMRWIGQRIEMVERLGTTAGGGEEAR